MLESIKELGQISGQWELQRMKETVDELQMRQFFTPDFHDLCAKKNHIVMVYDNTKFGGPKHGYVSASKFLGRAITLDTSIMARKVNGDCYAWRVPSRKHLQMDKISCSIAGQAYAMSVEDLVALDVYMFDKKHMCRESLFIELLDQNAPTKKIVPVTIAAWIYFLKEEDRYNMITKSTNVPKTFIAERSTTIWDHRTWPNDVN